MHTAEQKTLSKKKTNILSKDDRKTSQGFVDIKSKTIEELEELIERQNKILEKRSILVNLPDKGKKILEFKSVIENEIKKRQQEYHSTCELFSNLSLKEFSSEEIEWNGGKWNKSDAQLDSDDDSDKEVDPLKLFVSHSGTVRGKNVTKCLDDPGVTVSETIDHTLYAKKFCEKYGNKQVNNIRYKPNQLKDNDKSVFKVSAEKLKNRLGNKWEITQATPPVPVFNDTEYISLSESLKLQKQQAQRLKEIERKHAEERLMKNGSVKLNSKLPLNFTTEYRTAKNVFDETPNVDEDSQNSDSDSEEKGNFTEENSQCPQPDCQSGAPEPCENGENAICPSVPASPPPDKEEEKNCGSPVRPGTVSGGSGVSRKRTESEEKDWSGSSRITKITTPSQSKNSWSDRGSTGSNGSVALSTYAKERKRPGKCRGRGGPGRRVDFPEDAEVRPLLMVAVCEQERVTESLQAAKEELWKKVMGARARATESAGDRGPGPEGKTRGALESLNNLDEVFQVWIHLFYFIINLRINLIRIVNVGGTEAFRPNADLERDVVTKAVECVKFFSKLKMKSLMESLEELEPADEPESNDSEIVVFEKRMLSPFLLEMEFMGKKAKEMLSQLKKENERKTLTT